MRRFPLVIRGGPFPIRRLGRFLLWQRPSLYRWVGIIRQYGDCLKTDFDIWMGGYPRSANTFAAVAFKLANPKISLASHFHVPAFIIQGLKAGKPGIFLIRRPEDCVVSWTLYWNGKLRLEDSLNYYVDFHLLILPHLKKLFVATFEQTTSDFGQLVSEFNARFGTHYATLPTDAAALRSCVAHVEDFHRSGDGSVNELTVSRPSAKRAALKPDLLIALRQSPRLREKLNKAELLYDSFYKATVLKATHDRQDH